MAALFFLMMFILLRARRLRELHTEFVDLKHYVGMIQDLQADNTVPKEATNLVYLAVADSKRYIDSNIIYSILKSVLNAPIFIGFCMSTPLIAVYQQIFR
jgi:KUP system potassium uptake protein